MKEVSQELAGIGGTKHRKGYRLFCSVIAAAIRSMPEDRSMQELCEEVGAEYGKKGGTVYKALARTVKDIWENGNRKELERIIGYSLYEELSPKEMVMGLAQALGYRENVQVEYRIVESGLPPKYGICGGADPNGDFALLAPFSTDHEAVQQLVEQLNREKPSMRQFREMLLNERLVKF